MLSLFDGFTLSQQPALLMRRTHDNQPASALRRCVKSSKRYSGLGGSEEVFESRIEEMDGSGLKRVVVERGLGSKAMKLTQVSDGSGGTTEERVFRNVSKEEESLFEDSHWPQAAAKHMSQTPVKALTGSLPADTPNNDSGSSSTPQDSVPAPTEQEVDTCGVPIAGSFEATDDGSFHAAGSSASGPNANATAGHEQHDGKPPQQQTSQQQQQQAGQQQQQQIQQSRQKSRLSSRHCTALDADPFSRQLLALQQLSRAFSPNMRAFDAWPLERPALYFPYALSPVYDPFADAMFRHPLIDVRF
jgi:hypothetical protein